MKDNIQIFIPDCLPDDITSIRLGLMKEGYYPIMWDDYYPFPDLLATKALEIQKHKYFDDACEGVKKTGALGLGVEIAEKPLMLDLIAYCKANNLPVYIYNNNHKVKPLNEWLNEPSAKTPEHEPTEE